jgi:hypothetical protein
VFYAIMRHKDSAYHLPSPHVISTVGHRSFGRTARHLCSRQTEQGLLVSVLARLPCTLAPLQKPKDFVALRSMTSHEADHNDFSERS